MKFDIKRGGYSGVGNLGSTSGEVEDLGTITFGLYGYVVPGTVRNFCEIAAGFDVGHGEHKKTYTYAKYVSYIMFYIIFHIL